MLLYGGCSCGPEEVQLGLLICWGLYIERRWAHGASFLAEKDPGAASTHSPRACRHCVLLPQGLCVGFSLPPLTTPHRRPPSPVTLPCPLLFLTLFAPFTALTCRLCRVLVTFLLSICFPAGTGDPRSPWHEQSVPRKMLWFCPCGSFSLSLFCLSRTFLGCLCLRERGGWWSQVVIQSSCHPGFSWWGGEEEKQPAPR